MTAVGWEVGGGAARSIAKTITIVFTRLLQNTLRQRILLGRIGANPRHRKIHETMLRLHLRKLVGLIEDRSSWLGSTTQEEDRLECVATPLRVG